MQPASALFRLEQSNFHYVMARQCFDVGETLMDAMKETKFS